MTLLIQTLPALGRSVLEQLRDALQASSDPRITGLLSRVPSPVGEEPYRLVATGEYNAGKSSLLKALTGAEIPIHSDVTTTETHEYPWGDVLLVDTPGVKAGDALHDERAESALRSADLVVFVITVDLFDDATAAHVRHVGFDLGKSEQMVVVVNKAATMSAEEGIREEEVRKVLGPQWTGAMVECDARSSLGAAAAPTPDRAQFLVERGNQAGLEQALNDLVIRGAAVGRLKRPFEAALAVIDDVEPLLVPEPDEEAMTVLLERRQQVLAESRLRLDNRLEQAFATTRDQIIAAGDALVAAASGDAVPESAVDDFERQARASGEALGDLVARVLRRELDELTAEERGLLQGPEVQTLLDSTLLDADFDVSAGQIGSGPSGPQSSFARLIRQQVADRGGEWLDDAIKQGNRPGSPLHNIVYGLGKRAGHDFKPWEAVKWTKRLQGALVVGGVLVDVYMEVRSMQREEGELQRHQIDLRRQVREAADGLIDEARKELAPIVSQFFDEASRSVVELEESLARIADERASLREDLQEIARVSREALDTIAREGDGRTVA